MDETTNVCAAGFLYGRATFGHTNLTSAGLDDVFVFKLGTDTSPPYLTAARSGTNLTLSWPGSAVGFILEATDDLSNATSWTAVPDGTNGVAVPLSGTQMFFRLHKL